MRNTYFIYGLYVSVPFTCQVLSPVSSNVTPDVVIADGVLPPSLSDAILAGEGLHVGSNRVLMQWPLSVGNFLIEDGNRVTLERAPQASDDVLTVQFLDAALAVAMVQRGLAVLHANAAVLPAGAVAICGESGVGKSTALSALLARGYPMLTDDITACRRRADGVIEVLPGMPHLHLHADAAEKLGRDISGLPRFPWRRMKAVVPTSLHMATAPAPLRALYVLRTYDGETVRVQPLTGMVKFAVVQHQLYGPLLPYQHAALFPLLADLVRQTPVFLLWRPVHRWAVDEVIERIVHTSRL